LLNLGRSNQQVGLNEQHKRFLNNAEVKDEYQVKILNRFAALGNLVENMDINRVEKY
jgi:hypothetical protein